MVNVKLKKKKQEEAAMTGAIRPNPVYCKTCVHQHGEDAFHDGPDKAQCQMYYTDFKPRAVLFEGAECDFYEKE